MYTHSILASGGLDSLGAWAMFDSKDVVNVFVDIGQPYCSKELRAVIDLKQLLPYYNLVCVDGAQIGSRQVGDTGIIPFRNAELILCAAQFSPNIVMGVLQNEINSDKSELFMDAMQDVLNISAMPQYWNNNEGTKYTVSSPLRQITKTQLVANLLRLGHGEEVLNATVSCYNGDYKGHCGACPSCFKRWVAWVNNGLSVGFFESDPWAWGLNKGLVDKAKDGTYGYARAGEILGAYKRS